MYTFEPIARGLQRSAAAFAFFAAASAASAGAAFADGEAAPDQMQQQAPQVQQAPPTYAKPSYAADEEKVRGRITSFDGKYALAVRDERGFVDNVVMHDGTVINPTGIRLAQGMTVTIYGRNGGSNFLANEIDTPYVESPPVAYAYPVEPAYPYYGYGYGYPYYGYPYYGAYYPGFFGLDLGFNFYGGYHGGYGYRGYPAHGYNLGGTRSTAPVGGFRGPAASARGGGGGGRR